MSKNDQITTEERARRRAVIFVILLASFLPSFAGGALNVSIPVIGIEFHSSTASLGWILTAYSISAVSLMLPLGRLADLTSKRNVLIIGLVIFCVLHAVAIFVDSLPLLILLRVLQGVGSACMFATNQAILADAFPFEMRGRVLGMSVAAVYVGLSVGPVLGGLITRHLGWRWIFAFIAILAAVSAIVAIAKLPKKTLAPRTESLGTLIDSGGTILYMTGIIALMYGAMKITQNWWSYAILGLGVVLLVVFVLYEKGAKSPIVDMNMFKGNPNFLLSNLAALFNYGATFAVSYLLSIYLQMVKGIGPDISGIILITAPLMQAIVSPFAGRLSDKKSPFAIASFGMAMCTVALISFIFVGSDAALIHIILSLVVVGVGFGLFSSPNTNAIMSLAAPEHYGITASFVSTMRNVGQSLSMCAITVIMNVFIGRTPIDEATIPQITSSMRTAFIAFAIVCAVGVFISMNRKPADK
ncbi:MAG: MFS transporter [Clostridiales Family XIII bacterium]|jgi:EmrB/QacA subfamily drug resistance transporter|nr:MFS transporter [Clostridiales Family XIII bacterium]